MKQWRFNMDRSLFRNLRYIREEGRFIHFNLEKRTDLNGQYAGTLKKKQGKEYWELCVQGELIPQAALVWFYEKKSIPEGELYFRDGNCRNTHISNLTVSPVKTNGITCFSCKKEHPQNNYYSLMLESGTYICKHCDRDRRRAKRAFYIRKKNEVQ